MHNPFEQVLKKHALPQELSELQLLPTPEKQEGHAAGAGASPLSPWNRDPLSASNFQVAGPDDDVQHPFPVSASTSLSSEGSAMPLHAAAALMAPRPGTGIPEPCPSPVPGLPESSHTIWSIRQDGFDASFQAIRQRAAQSGNSGHATPGLDPLARVAQDSWSDAGAPLRHSLLATAGSLQTPPDHSKLADMRQGMYSWSGRAVDLGGAQAGLGGGGAANAMMLPDLGFLQQGNASSDGAAGAAAASAKNAAAALSGATASNHHHRNHATLAGGGADVDSLTGLPTHPFGAAGVMMGAGGHGALTSAAHARSSALAQFAAERGLDQSALAMLLQNPSLLDMLTTSNEGQQQQQPQQQQQQQQGQWPSHAEVQHMAAQHSPPTLKQRTSDNGRRSGTGAILSAASVSPSSLPLQFALPQPPLQLIAELTNTRNVLVQLMLSAFAFLHSDSMRGFYASLTPITAIYSSMHDLPVLQKQRCCTEMASLRDRLMQDPGWGQVLVAVCALRQHLYSLSRKVLILSQQSADAVPLDLLLGSLCSELHNLLKGLLPAEVLDFFTSSLPHPKLACLVFVEFTVVDPAPLA